MAKVAYVHVEPDGFFVFHRPDGTAVRVEGDKTYSTDRADEIAYLDAVPFVKRTKGGKED